MRHVRWSAAGVLGLLIATGAQAEPRSCILPDKTAELAAGPNLDTVQGKCGACHSAEYILTQPRGIADLRAL